MILIIFFNFTDGSFKSFKTKN